MLPLHDHVKGNPAPRATRTCRRWTRQQLPADLAAELRAARHLQGLSLRETAHRGGISAGYLSRLERGLRAPRRAVAERLVDVLRLDGEVADELLEAAVEEWRLR